MYRLIEFIRSISLLLLFLLLEGAAIFIYANSNSYTQARIFGLTSQISGVIGGATNSMGDYLSLRDKNDALTRRIIELESELYRVKSLHSDSLLRAHSLVDNSGIKLIAARVVRNSTNRQKNFILINRGYESGVRERMAVVTPKGEIVGSVISCNAGYSIVISLLNSDFVSSGKIKSDNHIGSLSWDGVSRYQIQLTDLSKYANIFVGAEVVTTGISQIFPEGLKIGEIAEFSYDEVERVHTANIELSAEISALNEVIVINSKLLSEGLQAMELFETRGNLDLPNDPSEAEFKIDSMGGERATSTIKRLKATYGGASGANGANGASGANETSDVEGEAMEADSVEMSHDLIDHEARVTDEIMKLIESN